MSDHGPDVSAEQANLSVESTFSMFEQRTAEAIALTWTVKGRESVRGSIEQLLTCRQWHIRRAMHNRVGIRDEARTRWSIFGVNVSLQIAERRWIDRGEAAM